MRKNILVVACGYLAQAKDAGEREAFIINDCESIPSGDNDCGEYEKPCPIDVPPMYAADERLVMHFTQDEYNIDECTGGVCEGYEIYKYFQVRHKDMHTDLVVGNNQARVNFDGIWSLGYPCTGGNDMWLNGFLQPSSNDYPEDRYYNSEETCLITAKADDVLQCDSLAYSIHGFTGKGSIELIRLNDPDFTYMGMHDATAATPDLECGWMNPCDIHTSSVFKLGTILRGDVKNPAIADPGCVDSTCPEYYWTLFFKAVETNIRTEWGDVLTPNSKIHFCEHYCLNEDGSIRNVCVNEPSSCQFGAYEGGPEGRPERPLWIKMDLYPVGYGGLPEGPRETTTTSTTAVATTTTKATTTAEATTTTKATTTEKSTTTTEKFEIDCAEDIHLEMVLLMDASYSFGDDITVLQTEFPRLMGELQRAFGPGHARFGLGTFVDKPIAPFGWPEDYCSKLHQPLTDDPQAIEQHLMTIESGGGNDDPEALLEALSTFAALNGDIGFNMDTTIDGRTIVRLLVAATDAPYHQAGDGLEFGLSPAVDGSNCQHSDYPSVDMVSAALLASKYTPALLVTKEVMHHYEELQAAFKEDGLKSFLGELEQDSSNIFDAVYDVLHRVCKDYASK